jgi:hypothetical protein
VGFSSQECASGKTFSISLLVWLQSIDVHVGLKLWLWEELLLAREDQEVCSNKIGSLADDKVIGGARVTKREDMAISVQKWKCHRGANSGIHAQRGNDSILTYGMCNK